MDLNVGFVTLCWKLLFLGKKKQVLFQKVHLKEGSSDFLHLDRFSSFKEEF